MLENSAQLSLYTQFVCLRQEVFYRKLSDPRYIDSTLGTNKFTNVYRFLDRVSQYELKEVIYSGTQDPLDVLYRIFLFNQFKTECFWELWKRTDMTLKHLPELVAGYKGSKKLYTNAYIVPGKTGESKANTIAGRCQKLREFAPTLKGAIQNEDIITIFAILRGISGIGDFLASQVCFDFLWHESTVGWKPLYMFGVGAVRGAKKLGLSNSYERSTKLIENYLLPTFPYLTFQGIQIPLSPADIQNTFCEVDKYLRIVSPELTLGKNSPKRIKNSYTPHPKIDYVLPGFFVGKSGLVPFTFSDLGK